MVLSIGEHGLPEIGMTTEYVEAMRGCLPLAQLVTLMDREKIQGALDEIERLNTIGPIFDPTAYMRTGKSREQWSTLLVAILKFHDSIISLRNGDT